MENFLKEMIKVKPNIRTEHGLRIYNHIETKSSYKMSIQCSEHHYCTPRRTIGITEYETYEVAIVGENGFAYPSDLENFHRKEELDECYEGTVFGEVPKDLVEDLYNFLNGITLMK